ncbi:MAG: hypothetical protein V1874_17065 [Spirochaetota bacterium]
MAATKKYDEIKSRELTTTKKAYNQHKTKADNKNNLNKQNLKEGSKMRRVYLRIWIFVLPIVLSMILASCGAGSFIKKDAVKAIKKSALISVSAFKEVELSDTGSSMITAITEMANKSEYNTINTLNYLKNRFIEKNSPYYPFKLSSETDVLSRKGLKNLIPSRKGDFIAPLGYPVLQYDNNEAAAKFLKDEKDFDSAVIVNVIYHLKKSGFSIGGFSMGKIKATVDFSISVFDRKGELISQKGIEGESKNTIGSIMGGYDASEVKNICKEANDDAISKYIEWLKAEGKKV